MLQTKSRTIAKVVAPTVVNPAISRLIGTVDVDGAGTVHSLAEVDPFILLDYGTIATNGMPAFGPHPHYGHSVATILLQGKLRYWDSFHNDEKHGHSFLQGPGTYHVDAGSGLFHEEQSVIIDKEDDKEVRLFQLWMNIKHGDRSKPPRVQISSLPTSIECLDPQSGQVVGHATHHLGGDGIMIETLYPVSVVHIHQNAGTTYRVPIVPGHGGFVVHLRGKASYGAPAENSSITDVNTVLVLANIKDGENDDGADGLQVTTTEDEDTEYLVCSGERIQEPWVKKLVANGALIERNADEARVLATKVEEMATAGKAPGGSFAPFGIH